MSFRQFGGNNFVNANKYVKNLNTVNESIISDNITLKGKSGNWDTINDNSDNSITRKEYIRFSGIDSDNNTYPNPDGTSTYPSDGARIYSENEGNDKGRLVLELQDNITGENIDHFIIRAQDASKNIQNIAVFKSDGGVELDGDITTSGSITGNGNMYVDGQIWVNGYPINHSNDSYWSTAAGNEIYYMEKVGVGINNPERILHTRGDTIRVDRDTNAAGIQLHRYTSGYGDVISGYILGVETDNNDDENPCKFAIANYGTDVSGYAINRFVIDGSGLIGINTQHQGKDLSGTPINDTLWDNSNKTVHDQLQVHTLTDLSGQDGGAGISITSSNVNIPQRLQFGAWESNGLDFVSWIQNYRDFSGNSWENGLQIGTENGRPIQFFTSPTTSGGNGPFGTHERMRIDSSGNVGIGTTQNDGFKFVSNTNNDATTFVDTPTTYSINIRNTTNSPDVSGISAMKFEAIDSSSNQTGASAIVLENSGNSYAMNFYVKTGPGDIDSNNKVIGIQNDGLFRVYKPSTYEHMPKIYDEEAGEYVDLNIYQNNTISVNKAKQSLTELLTQQPDTFEFSVDDHITPTSSYVKIAWSLDHLYPYVTTSTSELYTKLHVNTDNMIPKINKIVIDVSNETTGGWVTIAELDQTGNTEYDLSFNILKPSEYNSNEILNFTDVSGIADTSFNARVYGVNSAINYPTIDNRSLIYENLEFLDSLVPYVSSSGVNNVGFNNNIPTSFFIQVESGILDSKLVVSDIEINGSIFDSLRVGGVSEILNNTSFNINIPNTIEIPVFTFNYTISGDVNNIYYGAKYSYSGTVTNSDDKSATSNLTYMTHYTDLPDSNGIGTSLSFNGGSSTYNFNLNGNNIIGAIYVNPNHSNNTLSMDNNNKIFEITNSNASITANINTAQGTGTYVDGVNNLSTIEVSYNGNSDTLTFGGFNTTHGLSNGNFNSFNTNNILETDIWNGTELKEGFRKKAQFSLNDIDATNFTASATQQTLNINYTNSLNPSSNSVTPINFYADNLSGPPSINSVSFQNSIYTTAYCFGVPSVKEINNAINFNISNINSVYRYLPLNKRVLNITYQQGTSGISNLTNFDYNVGSINDSGTYGPITQNAPNKIYFTSANTGGARNVTATITASNLIDDSQTSATLDLNSGSYYCDYTSFNKDGNGMITTPNNPTFYECTLTSALADPQSLNGGFNTIAYSNHTVAPSGISATYNIGKFTIDTTKSPNGNIVITGTTRLSSTNINGSYSEYVFYINSADNQIRIGNVNKEFDGTLPWTENVPTTFNDADIRGAYNNNTGQVEIPTGVTYYYLYIL